MKRGANNGNRNFHNNFRFNAYLRFVSLNHCRCKYLMKGETMKNTQIHIYNMQFQIGSIRGALNMSRGFIDNENTDAAKMTVNDALRILEKLEQNLNALNAENMKGETK